MKAVELHKRSEMNCDNAEPDSLIQREQLSAPFVPHLGNKSGGDGYIKKFI